VNNDTAKLIRDKLYFYAENVPVKMSTRQNKVAKQIQKDIAEILLTHTRFMVPGKMLTVTSVRISPDLSVARIYISVFPSDNSVQVISLLNEHLNQFRNELGQRLRNQLKKMPEFSFFLDDSLDYLENIENLLK
jgi:ribosome-binding factor A